MSNKSSASRWKSWPWRLLAFLIGLGTFAFLILMGGWQALQAPFRPAVVPFMLCLLMTGMMFWLSSLRWGRITNALEGRKVGSYSDFFFYSTLGRLVGQYVSQVGSDLALKPLMLRSFNSLPVTRGLAGVLWDKGIDLLFVLTLLPPAVIYILVQPPLVYSLGMFGMALIVPFALVIHRRLLSALAQAANRALLFLRDKASRLPWIGERFALYQPIDDNDTSGLLDRRTLLVVLALSAAKHLTLALRLYFLSQALHLSIPFTALWAGLPPAQLSVLFAITPGALGILEGGWYAVLSLTGETADTISAFLAGQRLYTLFAIALFLLVGYVSLVIRALIQQQAWLHVFKARKKFP